MSDSEDDRQDKKRKAQFEDDAQFKKQKSLNSADDDDSNDQDESDEDSDSGSDTEQAQQPRKQTNSAAAGEASGDDDDNDDDDDEDGDEDEEDDEDDEEENDPDAKARKRIRARYFDEAAEEEDGGGAFEHDAKQREEEAYRRVRAENDAMRARREAAMSEREIAARYEERHQAEAHQREVIEALTEQDTSELRKQTSLPTPDGPKLWMIKCKEGKEKEIVVSIMNKAVATAGRGGRMGIMSAVNTAPGVVFVEAMSEIIVKDAVNGIQNLYAWRPKSIELTPIRQMVDVVTVRKEFDTFKRGQWVRMKRGVYKDDLAQVDDVRDGGAKLLLRAIPRINLARIGLTDADKKLKGRGPRPPQRMFDKRDIEAAGGEVESYPHFRGGLTRRGSAYRWQGDTYLKGFLYKEVKANTVDPNGRPPTLEDKQRFQMRRGAGSDTEDMGMDFDVGNAMGGGNVADILSGADVITAEQEMTLAPGDKVQVTEGALARLEGIVLEIKESTKTFLMKTTNFESDAPLEMPIHEVVKQFSTGDHVKIVGGKTQLGETGEVLVAGEDNESGIWKCTLLLDSGRQEVDVFNRDLKLSAEVVTSVGELDGYKLYDLVELGANEAGIIVHVGRTTLDVLTQQGEKRTIRPQQIKAQLNFRGRSMAMDADREKLAEGDVVKVVNGQHKGMEGTVKRVHSMYLFLHSNREMQNAGVFVARARQTKLAGANQRPKASVMGDIFSNPRPGGPGGAGRGRGRGRGVDPLMGKTVRVLARGVYKGLAGKVVALTDSTVDVELESRMKVVTIPRSRVKELGAAERASTGGTVPGYQAAGGGGGYGYGLGGMTPALGSQTPGLGSRTPGYAGSQTPGYAGSQTPGYAGSETPAHGGSSVWDSKTPLHNSIIDNAWNTGGGGAYDRASHNSFSGIASSDMRMSSNMSLASTPGQSPMSDISRASGPALASGLCVKVTGGLHAGAIGYVQRQLPGGDSMCIVELADGRGITHEPKHNLVPTDVRVGDRVRSMTQTHEEGQVQSIQGDQVIVRLDVGGTKLLSTSQVMTVRPTH